MAARKSFYVCAGLVCLALAPLSAPQTARADDYVYVTQWAASGYRVATDGAGNVYVADAANNRIQKFTSAGSFVTQWGSFGTGDYQFAVPYGVATDGAGNVNVVDYGNDRIVKFTSTGTYITQWNNGGGSHVAAATDGAGNVYVVDYANDRIQKFTSAGSFVTQWGSFGHGNGLLNQPNGVATDGAGNVYVADSGNNLIQKFTGAGTYITQWGASGIGNGEFHTPYGVATDGANSVYVADFGNSRIQKFTSGGIYLTQWGKPGNGPGQFNAPTGVATDGAGNVYVSDLGNNRIQKFGPASGVGVPGEGPLAFALDPVRPDPVRSGSALTVQFTLPGAGATSLELLDVAGRLVSAREVGQLGAGRHALDFSAGRTLAPGIYLVRLQQGANVNVVRAAVLGVR